MTMKFQNLPITIILAAFGVIITSPDRVSAQTTAFTYQGRLVDSGTPASGAYDLQFSVLDGPTNGVQIGSTVTITNSAVTNGLLTATLDFGSGIFTGPDRWLQIGVRLGGSTNVFATLWPLQALTPAPYAIYSALAGSVPTGTISSAQMAPNAVGTINVQSNAITLSKIAAGQIVKSLNGLRDDVVLVPGAGLSLTTSGNVLQLSAAVGSYWNVNGNSSTTSTQFLGTIDSQPLELRVNNTRALRLEPTASSPNIIAGYVENAVGGGSIGATISGGGAPSYGNLLNASWTSIGGGYENSIYSGSLDGTIGGGVYNRILTNSIDCTIGGGYNNMIGTNSFTSVISGGAGNVIGNNADDSFIASGRLNVIQNGSVGSAISGGVFSTIGSNSIGSTIAGGWANGISTNAGRSTICGGYQNTNQSQQATIGGGAYNSIKINASSATIAGGVANTASANNAAIIGGNNNTASGDTSTIGGGYQNNASGPNSFIGGGSANTAKGQYSAIPGGYNNTATNDFTFAAGRRAKANHQGAFVWGDSTDADVASSTNNQFVVRASGGVLLYSDPTAAFGVYLPPGGGAFSSLSDRNAKTNILVVNGRDVLERLVAIPIATWNYKSQSDAVHHMGAMAQDFAAAFGLGEDAKHISTVDADGVALAAIQGLNQKLQDELKQRDAESAELKARLDQMQKLIDQLSKK